ncbi:MAG: cytochrome P450 [Methylovulum sp.]|nr:cytochrome P450 [Methylovulum sp.]
MTHIGAPATAVSLNHFITPLNTIRMTDFIPPFPIRHKKNLGPLDTLKYARRDLLSIWPESAFDRQFMATKIINKSIFIANHPEIIRYVLLTNHANYEKKSPLMRKALEPLLGDGLFISDGDTWQKHRNLEAPLFGNEQVAKYSDIMIKTTEERAQSWARFKPGETIHVLPEMGQLTAEIICRTLFGNQLGAAQATQVVKSFAEYQAAIEQMDVNTFFGLPSWIPGLGMGKGAKAAKAIHHIVDKVIAEGIKSDNKDSLLGHFLRLHGKKDVQDSLTKQQIRNELIVLFMAGHETTANTLAWAWYLISQCPDVEQRLHDEVDAVLGNRSATFADVAKLTYTRAVIEETMRLYPPVPILSREASADDTIRRRHIPAGSIMLVVPWLLHRHKQYWQQPDHFIPERFLDDAPVKPDKFTYIPFSVGPRVCIAKFFGTVETTLCLAILARQFRLRVPEGHQVTHECRLTLRPKDNLPMQISPR